VRNMFVEPADSSNVLVFQAVKTLRDPCNRCGRARTVLAHRDLHPPKYLPALGTPRVVAGAKLPC
jgi:hypothetical protein